MLKVRTFKLLPLGLFIATAQAEIAENKTQQIPVINEYKQDSTTPFSQLSLAEQQLRAEQAERDRLLLEQLKIEDEQKLLEAEYRLQQIISNKPLLLSKATAKVYLDNHFEPMWQDKQAQRLFLREYALFAASGVSPKSTKALEQILKLNDETLEFDILLTDSFLDYLYYNKNVAKQANQWLYQLGSYQPQVPAQVDIVQWIEEVKSGNAAYYIQALIPKNRVYLETADKLFAMDPTTMQKSGSSTVLKQTLKPNMTSPEVAVLAQKLLERGLISQLPQTNKYDIELVNAVKTLQAQDHLPVSGIVNKATRAILNPRKNSSVSFAKLALNVQRLRILPDFDNGIFVNIPSYQLYYFRNGKLELQSRVIVGRDERRTPVLYSKLSNVVVNPPWNAPIRLINEDLVPRMRKDPSYVERRSYEILDSKGRVVDPYSINWEAYTTKNFPYRIRQKPGDDSALGRFKFNMPSSDAIYLHDTPNKGLFSRNDRALSSGCVRVAKADELATILLKEAGWSSDRKQQVLASKRTTSANIQSDNPVYLYYVTAWVEGGKIHSLPDIYHFDKVIKQPNLDWQQIKQII